MTKLSELRVGDKVQLDAGFTCMEGIKEIQCSPDGFWVACDRGRHYLDCCADVEGNCIGITKIDTPTIRMSAHEIVLLGALKAVMRDIDEYERVNNLSPNPGKKDCWQSVTFAKQIITRVEKETQNGLAATQENQSNNTGL